MKTSSLKLCVSLAAALMALEGCGGSDDAPAAPPPPAPPPTAKALTAADCTALAAKTYDNTPVFASATWVEDGTQKAAASATAFLPAHCVVRGTINPRTGSDGIPYGIMFELKLPAQWNKRFFFQGGGGTDGSVQPANGIINSADGSNNVALSQGYAVVSTDGGHENSTLSNPAAFGLDPQARIDWGYNGIDKTATTAKSIIRGAYGVAPDHSYFVGCSTGGRQGMQFMQLFPSYFDGVVAGSPVMDLGSISAATVWGLQSVAALVPKDAGGNPLWSQSFSASDQKLFTDAYMNQCDALDGVKDGMVQNPAACHFDPAVLTCSGAKDSSCWTAAQVAAVKRVVGGPVTSSGGPVLVPGYSFVHESAIQGYPLDGNWMTQAGQAGRLVGTATSPPGNLTQGAAAIPYLYITPPDPSFKPLDINWDTYPDRMTVNSPWLSTSLDLAAFKSRGGKVIFSHGTGDPGPSYANTVNYYTRLTQLNGGESETQKFARLFLVPSMGHCSGGPAADSYDPLAAIVNWVENGVAPDSIVAKTRAANTALTAVTPVIPAARTRPLCTYPKTAAYKGSGSAEDAANFSCQ